MSDKDKIIKYLQNRLKKGLNTINKMEIAMDLKIPFKTIHRVVDELIADGSLSEFLIESRQG
jgi:hypothetical protein